MGCHCFSDVTPTVECNIEVKNTGGKFFLLVLIMEMYLYFSIYVLKKKPRVCTVHLHECAWKFSGKI